MAESRPQIPDLAACFYSPPAKGNMVPAAFFSLQTPANVRPALVHSNAGNMLGLGLGPRPTQVSDSLSGSRQAKENLDWKKTCNPADCQTARKTPVHTIYDLLREMNHEGILADLPMRRRKPKIARTIHDLIH